MKMTAAGAIDGIRDIALQHNPLTLDVGQDLILAYGRSDEKAKDDARAKALFDKSTARTTIRASIYAKGS